MFSSVIEKLKKFGYDKNNSKLTTYRNGLVVQVLLAHVHLLDLPGSQVVPPRHQPALDTSLLYYLETLISRTAIKKSK